MSECREVQQYEREIAEAKENARDEWALPGQNGYWAGVIEAAKSGAHKAALAHKLGKCSCQIRNYLDRRLSC